MPENNLITCYLPLPGMLFNHLEIGYINNKASICKPYPDEWRSVSKSDVWIETVRGGHDLLFNEHNVPVCLNTYLANENGDINIADKEQTGSLYEDGKFAVIILRLFKSGWFFDPFLYQVCVRKDVFYVRSPGPFRQIDFGRFIHSMGSRYEISLDELYDPKLENQEKTIVKTAHLIDWYRAATLNTSIEYALRHFNLSYSLFKTYAQKCSYLFTALDTILGGMSARKINETSIKTPYKERVEILLQGYPGGNKEAAWLDNAKSGGRFMRNNIAHGQHNAIEELAKESYERLQNIVRYSLKLYISFYVVHNADKEKIQEYLGLDKEKTLPELFSIMIDNVYKTDPRAIHLAQEIQKLF